MVWHLLWLHTSHKCVGKAKATSAGGHNANVVPCITSDDDEIESGSENGVINTLNEATCHRTSTRANVVVNFYSFKDLNGSN